MKNRLMAKHNLGSCGTRPPHLAAWLVSLLLAGWACLAVPSLSLADKGLTAVSSTASAESGPTNLDHTAQPPSSDLEPLLALDAYLQGMASLRDGAVEPAIRHWRTAAAADPQSLPVQLALARTLLLRDPGAAAVAWRGAMDGILHDYRDQQWAVRHALLGLALAGSLAAMLIALGTVARHIRAVHHVILETLAWSIRPGLAAHLLTVLVLALPLLADLGPLATVGFWLFLCGFRLSRSERILALGLMAWAVLLGPALLLCRPLWSTRSDGFDATLIYEIEREPVLPCQSAATMTWLAHDPDEAAPLFLDGLRQLETGQASGAEQRFRQAGELAGVPIDVLEANLGRTAYLLGNPSLALRHLSQAERHNPESFAVQYNRGLILSGQGEFAAADHALDAAGHLDLDRLRRLGRVSQDGGPRPLIPVLWSRTNLWEWTMQHPGPAVPPTLIASLLPMRDLRLGGPICLAAGLGALLIGRWLRRRLTVRVCYQCGRAICRRCLIRIDRHAYCKDCGHELGAVGVGETTRLLIRRLLDDGPRPWQRIGWAAAYLLPGVGAGARGASGPGAVSSILAGLGLALILFPWWGRSILPLIRDPLLESIIRLPGLTLIGFSLAMNTAGVRGAERSRTTLRAFLSRDVDRMAA
jgi:hypothetical protein